MRRFTSLLLLMLISVVAFADNRTVEEAKNEAMSFLMSGTNTARRALSQEAVKLEYTLQQPNKQDAAAYVFQIGEDNGFVLVSADDNATTILGYASDGKFDSADIPENMQIWLEHYAEEIAWAAEHGVNVGGQKKAGGQVISPLLGDIVWNQGEPFWNLCPLDSDGNRSYTGCVATAAAQIMRYWNHPTQGNGSHSYRWTKSNGTTKTLSANFGDTTYDWDNMIPNYNYGYNNTQANAVATLMYHLGVATEMGYSSEGSGTQTEVAAQALYKYFDYDKSMEAVRPDYCGFEYFEERMLAELQAGRPVLMSGATVHNEGHAFVCDGYDGQLFHINWGWGGYQNAYFVLSALDPDAQGMGGAASGEGFHVRILGVMGIKPNEGGDDVVAGLGTNSITLNAGSSVGVNENFAISMNQIHSVGIADFEGGGAGFGVFDENDELVAFHSLYTLGNLPVAYYYPDEYDFEGDLSDLTEDGHYTIAPVFTDYDVTWYEKMKVGKSSIQEIPFRKEGNIIYFSEEGTDPEPTVTYPVTNLQAWADGNTIHFTFDCDAPYYHAKVYNSTQTLADAYIDFTNAQLSNVPEGTWTVWVCGADANKHDAGEPATVTVTVEATPDVDNNIYNLDVWVEGNKVYFSYESNAPNYHVKLYNESTTYVSTVTSYQEAYINNVPDGEWTFWVRPVDEAQENYVGNAVSTTVTVDTRDYITLQLKVNDSQMGTVSGAGEYRSGDTANIKATAKAGYEFVKWSDGNTNASRTITFEKTGESPRTMTLTAEFKKSLTYEISNFQAWVEENTIHVTFDTDAPKAEVNIKNMTTGTTSSVVISGHEYTRKNLTDGNYEVWVISMDENQNHMKTSEVATLTIDTREYITLVVVANDDTMGDVSGAGEYRSGDTAIVTATAKEGFIFVRWNDGSTEASRSITFGKTGIKERTETMTAFFEIDPSSGVDTILYKNARKGKYLKDGKIYIQTKNHQYNAGGKVLK